MFKYNIFFALIFFCTIGLGCGQRIKNLDSSGETIVCFGDSITAGLGAEEGKDYPSVLREKFDLKVINSGVSGDTSRDALMRLEDDVLAYNPKIVIVEFGANDVFGGMSKEETFKNIEEVVDKIHNSGAIVVLVKVELMNSKYDQGFKDISKRSGALLIDEIMNDILKDSELLYDQIHPNAKGYKIIAERIYQKTEPGPFHVPSSV